MKNHRITTTVLAFGLLAGVAAVRADSFGGGAFTMDFVDIGNAGNAADDTGYGGVDYEYRMGKYEVSRAMVTSYNALSGGPTITLQDMTSWGGNGPNRAATGISWNEAARFVNWLNRDAGFQEAYKFTTDNANDDIALWAAGDVGYDPANPFRNSNAHYFLPSEDEWYKAAYYAGTQGVYFDYATGSNTPPTAVTGGTVAGTAVYGQSWNMGPADITNAGGLSPYGTMAQNGNAWEWIESGLTPPNDSGGERRVERAGSWANSSDILKSSNRFNNPPATEDLTFGFRVAAVPEPSGFSLAAMGFLGFLLRRKR